MECFFCSAPSTLPHNFAGKRRHQFGLRTRERHGDKDGGKTAVIPELMRTIHTSILYGKKVVVTPRSEERNIDVCLTLFI